MQTYTVSQAAERTGWSPRMLRYLESTGLVVPERSAAGYRRYGLQELELLRGLAELREAVPGVQPVVVVNKLRAGAIPGDAEKEVRAALARYAGVQDLLVLPADVDGLDRALAGGRTLAEVVPQSPLRVALAAHAASLAGVSRAARSRGRRRLLTRR